MIFSLDVCRARKGDCLLLHYGTKDEPRPDHDRRRATGVYTPHLKPRLARDPQGARARRRTTPLPVDLLMVSHVDDDHIKGMLELTSELIAAADRQPLRAAAWRASGTTASTTSSDNEPEELTAGFERSLRSGAATCAAPRRRSRGRRRRHRRSMARRSGRSKVLASIAAGRAPARRRELPTIRGWNRGEPEVQGQADHRAARASTPMTIDGGLKFTVVGPMEPELRRCRRRTTSGCASRREEEEVRRGGACRLSSTSRCRICRASWCSPKLAASACC